MIHYGLVSGGSINITLLQDKANHSSIRRREQCSRNVLRYHANLLIGVLPIYQASIPMLDNVPEDPINVWERHSKLMRVCVLLMLIYHSSQPQFTIIRVMQRLGDH